MRKIGLDSEPGAAQSREQGYELFNHIVGDIGDATINCFYNWIVRHAETLQVCTASGKGQETFRGILRVDIEGKAVTKVKFKTDKTGTGAYVVKRVAGGIKQV